MNSDWDWFGSFMIPIIFLVLGYVGFGFYMGGLYFSNTGVETFKKQAIENSCAQYNPTNGNFEWIKR